MAHVDGFQLDGYQCLLSAGAARKFDRTALDISESKRVRLSGVHREDHGIGSRPAIQITNCADVIAPK